MFDIVYGFRHSYTYNNTHGAVLKQRALVEVDLEPCLLVLDLATAPVEEGAGLVNIS